MSSPSAVELISIPESSYGQTPPLGTAVGNTVRFVSETLSGTPQTKQSAELRVDRMSSGEVMTGLDSGGDVNFELSKDPVYDDFFSGLMMNHWVVGTVLVAGTTTITKHAAPDDQTATITIAGDTSDIDGNGRVLMPKDVIVLSGFTTPENNAPIQVITVTDATNFEAVVPILMVDETATAGIVTVPDYVDIGSTILSWTLSKAYTDVLHLPGNTDIHSQRYTGSIVNQMSLKVAYGEIVTGKFTFMSNGYTQESPSLHQDVTTAGGQIKIAGTANPLNGSIDMPTLTVDGEPTDFCIQSIDLDMTNGATPQNCIGHLTPTKFNIGTAALTIKASIYLGDQSYDKFMPSKLSMLPIEIMFTTVNADGGYGFDLRAVQLSFPDPSATGGDSPIMIDASGTCRVGVNGESSMRIWRW
jgi:hypothetical protein